MLKDMYKRSMDVVYTNFLWITTSLIGIFLTLGAATTAMFHVLFQIIRYDEPTSVFSHYKKSLKENFWFSTLVWFFLLIVGGLIYLMYITALNQGLDWLVVLAIVSAYQWIIFFIYFFPTLALFKTDKPLTMIKNVLIIANTSIWTNIKVLGSLAFPVLLVIFVHPVFLIIAIGLYGFLVSFHLRKRFEPWIETLQKSKETEENL